MIRVELKNLSLDTGTKIYVSSWKIQDLLLLLRETPQTPSRTYKNTHTFIISIYENRIEGSGIKVERTHYRSKDR